MTQSIAESVATTVLSSCDDIERYVKGVVEGAPHIIDQVLDNVRVGWPIGLPLPGVVKNGIKALIMEAVREAATQILEAVAIFRMIARMVGRPSLLRLAAEALDANVVSASNSLDDEMETSSLPALEPANWDSHATQSYNKAFADQLNAVGGISEPALGLKDLLNKMADSIDQFMIDFSVAYVGFAAAAGGLALAIATCETIVGAIVGLVIAIVGFVVGIVSLVRVFQALAGGNADAANSVLEAEALTWPQSAFAK